MKRISLNLSKLNNLLIASFGSLILFGGVLIFFWKKIPPKIPWFYSLPWGEDQLMKKEGLIIAILIAMSSVLISPALSQWTKKEDKIIEKTITVSVSFIVLMLEINIIRILMIFTQ